ncbi:MAG TPA: hypothetical protein VKQ11_09265 [Candidatus Sulfotelmatobacter sp.]|nr:hypothetical protein [Candidatus Sulfotelmatobacter sp.]
MARFCAEIIQHIHASNFAGIELVVYRKGDLLPARSASLLARVRRRLLDSKLRKHALYDLYRRFDNRKRRPRNHPRDTVDCSGLLSGIDSMEVEPEGKGFVHRFPAEAIEHIRAKNLDVLIRFGFNIIKGDILSAARYGVWSYHHGDNEFYRGGPPQFWELYEHNPLCGVMLQVLTEELDAGLVLCKSLFATRPTISVSQNEFAPYWGATDLVIRKLNELHRYGWEYLQQRAVPGATYKGKRRLYRSPTNLEMVRWLGPAIVKKVVERPFRKATVQHWRIGIRLNTPPLYSRESDGKLQGFRWVESAKGHFWADPFLLEQEQRRWIFFEDYLYAEKRAAISCAEIAADGRLLSPTRCLDDSGQHYSYPYVFRDGDELFMTPESANSGSVDLYRCEEFPAKWSRQATLLRGKFVDPSIWRQDGWWWMMVSTADPDARCSALYLFFAKALVGPWTMHPANPISTDVRNNRGAGTIGYVDGRLIRPSQSCCPVYGYSFSFNAVTKLSPSEYQEHALGEYKPEELGVKAVHTYNWIPGVEVIDGVKALPRSQS